MEHAEQMRRVTITMDPDVHDKGKALARAERRDFSSYVEWLIKEESKKVLPKVEKPQEAAA